MAIKILIENIKDEFKKCTMQQCRELLEWLTTHIKEVEEDITKRSVDELTISARTRNRLYENNVHTLGELLWMDEYLRTDEPPKGVGLQVKNEIRMIAEKVRTEATTQILNKSSLDK